MCWRAGEEPAEKKGFWKEPLLSVGGMGVGQREYVYSSRIAVLSLPYPQRMKGRGLKPGDPLNSTGGYLAPRTPSASSARESLPPRFGRF